MMSHPTHRCEEDDLQSSQRTQQHEKGKKCMAGICALWWFSEGVKITIVRDEVIWVAGLQETK